VKLVVHAEDRPGLLNQLTSVLFTEETNIRSLEAGRMRNATDGAVIDITVDVRDKSNLKSGVRVPPHPGHPRY